MTRTTFIAAFIGFVSIAIAPVALAGEHDAILGKWTTANAKSTVDIYECGGKVCGKIIALKVPRYPADDDKGMAGQIKIDRENPDPALQKKPLIGLLVLKNFDRVEPGLWRNGTIYDPENGKTYKCKLTLESPKNLHVRGYIGFSFIGRTTEWTR